MKRNKLSHQEYRKLANYVEEHHASFDNLTYAELSTQISALLMLTVTEHHIRTVRNDLSVEWKVRTARNTTESLRQQITELTERVNELEKAAELSKFYFTESAKEQTA